MHQLQTIEHMMMMRRIFFSLFSVLLILLPTAAGVPNNRTSKFDPAAFEAAMEQYVATAAGLSPAEAGRFFPLYRELHRKMRGYFMEKSMYRHTDTNDDEASCKAIKRLDEIDLKMKELQQHYHEAFMKVLPAGKVLKIIKAESRFHRQFFKKSLEGAKE